MARKKIWLATQAEYVVALALVNGLRYLPLPLAQAAAETATGLLDTVLPKLRRVARTNLGFAYPGLTEPQREHMIDGVFRSIARLLVALAKFPQLDRNNIHRWIEYRGLEHYLAAKQRGRGVLVATAHLGNWELSAFAHALLTEPMNVMVRPLDNSRIDRLVETRRTLSGNHLIFKWDGARSVLRALRNNEAVGILIDQNTAASEGVFVNFFGKQACANVGFVRLACHAEAPVIPGFATWDEARGRYILSFYPTIEMTGDEAADTQRVHSAIEAIIRQHPDQWMWIHRRWKTRPAGEDALY